MLKKQTLRKSIKIKAVMMLLAWAVIFLHGIIPHKHNDQQDAHCHNIMHHACSDEKDYTFDERHHYHLRSAGDDHGHLSLICHFTTELVNSTAQDYLFIYQNGLHLKSLPLVLCSYISEAKFRAADNPSYRLMPLRAPPRA